MKSNQNKLFNTFFLAGYECAYALIQDHKRIDNLADTKHDEYCDLDYDLISELGIKTVREGFAWSQIDKGIGKYDFSRFEPMMEIAKAKQVQQIWDLNHFDYPEDLDPFTEDFIERFRSYAQEAVKVIRKYQAGTIFIVPWNEISYYSWIGGDMGMWTPYQTGKGLELKKQLIKASIAAMDSIWEVDSDVRFIQVDPFLFRRVKPNEPDKVARQIAKDFAEIRFQSWDMLCGKIFPELGGHPKYLDIIGVNYYYANQEWVLKDKARDNYFYWGIAWNSKYRISFAKMLKQIYKRYKRPILISETGSHGNLRFRWWKRTLREINDALSEGLPIVGVCAYPIVDRPDWIGFHLTNSGLWDFEDQDLECRRIPHERSIAVVKDYIKKWRIMNKL